jgi:hypothetical protein
MSYFESSVRVPFLISYPKLFEPHRVKENVSTLDILPTMCDLVGTKPEPDQPMDGQSVLPHLLGKKGHDTVIAEYTGEGTIAPLMMIKRGQWKYITCPTDGSQLFHLGKDPDELHDLVKSLKKKKVLSKEDEQIKDVFQAFEQEALQRWDFEKITKDVLLSQRRRKFVWSALRKGTFTSWDFNPNDDGREKYVFPWSTTSISGKANKHYRYIRSHMHLDDLERKARYPAVDKYGRETGNIITCDQAGSHGQ